MRVGVYQNFSAKLVLSIDDNIILMSRSYFQKIMSQTIQSFSSGAPHVVRENIVYFVTLWDEYTVSWNKKAYSKFLTYFADFLVRT